MVALKIIGMITILYAISYVLFIPINRMKSKQDQRNNQKALINHHRK